MSYSVLIDRTSYVSPNTYTTSLTSTVDLSEYEVGVGQAYLYNSWFTINQYPLNNNQFQLIVPTNSGSTTYTITIPNGSYQITELDRYLKYWMIANGLYLINSTTGLYTYYAGWAISPTNYTVQWITYPLPTSLPTGYTSGGMTFPIAANQHYQLTILSSNNFKDIVGFNPGTYPTVPTNVGTQTKESDYAPDVNPISTIQCRLSCVYNPLSSNSQLLHVFSTKGTSLGELIDVSPSYAQFTPCIGNHKEITLSFFDQNGHALDILDRNIVFKLVFRKRPDM